MFLNGGMEQLLESAMPRVFSAITSWDLTTPDDVTSEDHLRLTNRTSLNRHTRDTSVPNAGPNEIPLHTHCGTDEPAVSPHDNKCKDL